MCVCIHFVYVDDGTFYGKIGGEVATIVIPVRLRLYICVYVYVYVCVYINIFVYVHDGTF